MKPVDPKIVYYTDVTNYILAVSSPFIFFFISALTIERWFVSGIFTILAFIACDWAVNAKWPTKPTK